MIRRFSYVLLGALMLAGCSQIKGLFSLRQEPDPVAQTATNASRSPQSSQSSIAQDTTDRVARNPGRGTSTSELQDLEMQINELNFQVKKQRAEVDFVKNQLEEIQAKSEIWLNPLSVYDKEIVLKNGTTIYGKIVAQDEQVVQVETLIGMLTLERKAIVRIVDNEPQEVRVSETPVTRGGETKKTQPGTTGAPLEDFTAGDQEPPEGLPGNANCILVGNIRERTDASGNHIFTGSIKNTGEQRADFVKIHFTFRRNWSGDVKALTAFVQGASHTYKSGVTSDATLPPGAVGEFEMYVSKSFGNYIGYSYSIDWEEYE